MLNELGYDTASRRSKSWEEFSGPQAAAMDFVLTVCDLRRENPAHIGLVIRSPLTGVSLTRPVRGTDAEKRAAFMEAYRRIAARVTAFVNLDLEKLDLSSLKE